MEDRNIWQSYKKFFLLTVEIKGYNVIIDGRNFVDQPIKDNLRAYYNIRKTAIGQSDDYPTGCLIDYPYFKNYYKLIAKDLSKQQKLGADPKSIQQVKFTGNLDQAGITQMFFIIEEAKEIVLDFSKGTIKVLRFCFVLI